MLVYKPFSTLTTKYAEAPKLEVLKWANSERRHLKFCVCDKKFDMVDETKCNECDFKRWI